MKESEWIVSPKQLKENQRRAIEVKQQTFEETSFYNFMNKTVYFMLGVAFITILINFMA